MPDPLPLLPTTLVGSYPQPEWLIDREKLAARLPPRVRATRPLAHRSGVPRGGAGRRDAARDPRPGARRAGHRHRRRDPPRELLQPLRASRSTASTSTTPARCSTAAATRCRCRGSPGRSGAREPVQVARRRSSCARTPTARSRSRSPARSRCPSRRRTSTTASEEERRATRSPTRSARRSRDLFAAGADIVQLDEPWMEARAEQARSTASRRSPRAGRRATARPRCTSASATRVLGKAAPSALPLPARAGGAPADQISIETAQSEPRSRGARAARGKSIILGVIALDTDDVEPPATVAERIRRALPHKRRRGLVVAPDCGMKYLPREAASRSCRRSSPVPTPCAPRWAQP